MIIIILKIIFHSIGTLYYAKVHLENKISLLKSIYMILHDLYTIDSLINGKILDKGKVIWDY